MASAWSVIVGAVGDRIDAELLPALYERASVPTSEIRAELRAAGIAFVDTDAGENPDATLLAEAAQAVAKSGARTATVMGLAGGFAGAVALPPEVIGQIVQTLRTAQRLAVVYGFDPDTDVGKLVLWRAIAAAYDIDLPAEGKLDLRVRELPRIVSAQLPARRATTAWLARQILSRSIVVLATRAGRLIPGLGAGFGGWSAHRRATEMATRMTTVYARASAALPFDLDDETLAVEIR